MNELLGFIYLSVFLGLAVYLLKKIIDLFFHKGRLYVYDGERHKFFWGCIKYCRSRKVYSIYGPVDGMIDKRIGEVQVKDDGMAWVRCWKRGYSPDELPYELGYVNLNGEVFTADHQRIGYVGQQAGVWDIDGVTNWTELFLKRHAEIYISTNTDRLLGHCEEIGRFRKRKSHEYTILARAAAFLLLYRHNGLLKPVEEERIIQVYAWGDTALLASVVFMLIYGILKWFFPHYVMFPIIDERLSFGLAMLVVYALTWAILREVKIELYLDEKPVRWWLALFNSNVGLSGYNWLIKVFAVIGLLFSIFVFDGDYAFLMLVILFGIIINEKNYVQRVWEVQTRFVYLPDVTIVPLEDEGELVRQYEWELDCPDDKKLRTSLQLRFKKSTIDSLRLLNPFRKGYDFYNYIDQMFKEDVDDHHLAIINQHIASFSNEYQLTILESIQFVLDFVQEPNIRYEQDKDSTSFVEYVRFPEETLFDKVGDCDCKAMLAAALFHNANLKVLYITSETHAAVAVECRPEWFGDWNNSRLEDGLLLYQGRHYYFCETTGDRFRVGDINGDISQFKYIKLIDDK